MKMAILNALPVLAKRGVVVNNNEKSPDYLPKVMKREMPEFKDLKSDLIQRALTEMIDDDVLVPSVKLDGKDGAPTVRTAHRRYRQGLWFGPKADEFKVGHTCMPDW